MVEDKGSGLNQRALEDRIRKKVIGELLSSGGVSYDRASKEVLYYLPQDFVGFYTEVFHQAFRDTDGGTAGRGKSSEEAGKLGRASGSSVGANDPLNRTRDKNLGVGHVRNGQKANRGLKQASAKELFGYNGALGERAAELKAKMDKDIRALTRKYRAELEDIMLERLEEREKAIEARVQDGSMGKGQASREIRAIREEKARLGKR